MNNDQNDLLSTLLSDPKNLALIANVAKNFMNAGNVQTKTSDETQTSITDADSKAENTDLPVEITSKPPNIPTHFTERENLLRSIKPYLKAERQPKVDSLLKALDIARIISSYSGNNLQ